MTLRLREAGALVPQPGETVSAYATGTHETAELAVTTAADGTVSVGEPGVVGNITTPAGPYNCGGSAYATFSGNMHHHNNRNYYVNGTSFPNSVTRTQWEDDVLAGADAWRNGRNRCGFPEGTLAGTEISRTSTSTTRTANISNAAACQSRDQYSVVSGGDLPGSDATGGTYGYTCVWSSGTGDYITIIEGDIKIDGYNWSWIPTGQACNSRLHLRSGMAHEFGHFMGLSHPSESSYGSLVMSPTLGRCEINARLGEGDYRGRDFLY